MNFSCSSFLHSVTIQVFSFSIGLLVICIKNSVLSSLGVGEGLIVTNKSGIAIGYQSFITAVEEAIS
ncbi:MAG: hypothetical protein J6T34_00535, partial [Bacilli bacterium]|nr:hypothetical protein [Bacilli bacterium]